MINNRKAKIGCADARKIPIH